MRRWIMILALMSMPIAAVAKSNQPVMLLFPGADVDTVVSAYLYPQSIPPGAVFAAIGRLKACVKDQQKNGAIIKMAGEPQCPGLPSPQPASAGAPTHTSGTK